MYAMYTKMNTIFLCRVAACIHSTPDTWVKVLLFVLVIHPAEHFWDSCQPHDMLAGEAELIGWNRGGAWGTGAKARHE